MKRFLTGWSVFALTALAVAVLCLLKLFVAALWVCGAGIMLSLAVGLFRHGRQNLKETAEKAAKELEENPKEAGK